MSPRVRGGSFAGWSALALGLLVVVGGAAALRPRALVVHVARAGRADLEAPILCDGTLEPGPELRAPASGPVAEIFVRDGDEVAQGAPLVRLDNEELAAKARGARSELAALEADAGRLRAELAESAARLKQLRSALVADDRLLAAGAIPRSTREADDVSVASAGSRLASVQAQLDALETPGERLALARAASRDLAERVRALTLRAPAKGRAYGLPRRVGEFMTLGQVVASVADPGHLRVRIRVDQPDIPRVEVGQRVVVSFDGLPDRKWEGRVALVSAGLREIGGRQVGEALSEIPDAEGRLPPNASVNVQIVAGRKASALVVPRAALFRDGPRRYVYVLEAGRARRRDVSAGLVGLTEVEILEGLSEGEQVILPGSFPLAPGLKVVAGEA